ncbi:MAG: GntR family transcriptional regulator [Pyrinomonadaceae bacterium]
MTAQLSVDKESKVPLYLQLKDQIKYYISTGNIKSEDQLPPVNDLAKDLGINFDTVRKAYKELEREGLISMKRGQGTFISLHTPTASKAPSGGGNERPSSSDPRGQLISAAKSLVKQYLQHGLDVSEARQFVAQAFDELEREDGSPVVVFAECNQFQVDQISGILSEQLQLDVRPTLLAQLESELPRLIAEGKEVHVVTTGFHVNEVRRAVGDLPSSIDVLITNLNPETRRQLEAAGQDAKYGFICRDQESAVLYKDLLKAELGFDHIDLASCTLAETEKVEEILRMADVVLASPPVYEEVKKLAPSGRPVFNVFERVDPMSLKVVRDRILGDAGTGSGRGPFREGPPAGDPAHAGD